MRKITVMIIILALMIPAFGNYVSAAMVKAEKGIVDAGNKLCPISGTPVSGTTFVVYKNKRYGLCCPGCKEEFLKDPEKYIAHLS